MYGTMRHPIHYLRIFKLNNNLKFSHFTKTFAIKLYIIV